MLRERVKSLLLIDFDDSTDAEDMQKPLGVRFGLLTNVQRIRTPPNVRVRERQQNAEDLLHEVADVRKQLDHTYAIGFTEEDIYVEGLNFAFGIGSPTHNAALVSTYRLTTLDPNLYEQRVLKESVHELGHVFGMDHCPNSRCVMHFSNTLEDTDFKNTEFCRTCAKGLRV